MPEVTVREIENFIFDKNLQKLEENLQQFDLFRILNKASDELTFSHVLRWLLDPNEVHGLNDYFLKRFLIGVVKSNKGNEVIDKAKFSIVNLDTFSFNQAHVRTEEIFQNNKRADITILDEVNNIYVLIENKIYSGESEDQTSEYYRQAKKRYPEHSCLFIFLTPWKDSPISDKFVTFSFDELLNLLREVRDFKESSLSEESKFLINQFIRNIEGNILEESKLDELCLKIYKNHQKAIDRIIQSKPDNVQYYEYMGEKIKNKLNNDWDYHIRSSYCAVYRNKWSNILHDESGLPIIHYEFKNLPEKLHIYLHVENWKGDEIYDNVFESLKETKIRNYSGINLNRKISIYSKEVSADIELRNIEKHLDKGVKEMLRLIEQTSKYIDEAVEKIPNPN